MLRMTFSLVLYALDYICALSHRSMAQAVKSMTAWCRTKVSGRAAPLSRHECSDLNLGVDDPDGRPEDRPSGSPGLMKIPGVAQVRVTLEKLDTADLCGARTCIAKNIEPIPDINDVNESVLDDRVAPHHDLVRAAAERRILQSHGIERRRREPAVLGRMRRVENVDRLQPSRVPGIKSNIRQHRRIVGAVAGELLGCRIVAKRVPHVTLEVLSVLEDLVFTNDYWVGWIGDADQANPSPRPAEARTGKGAVDLINVELKRPSRHLQRGVALGAAQRGVARTNVASSPAGSVRYLAD